MKLPLVRQRNTYDCGPAVARSVLAGFGIQPVHVDATLKADRIHGTPYDRLVTLFVNHGLTVEVGSEWTWDRLYERSKAGPVVVPITQPGGSGHWVAVHTVSTGRVRVMDPECGDRTLTRKEFCSVWTDRTPDGLALVRFGIGISAGIQQTVDRKRHVR